MDGLIKTILLVEDDPLMLECLEGIVRDKTEHKVVTAPDGFEAVKIIQKNRIDLVATNLNMPNMDGFQVMEYLIRERPGLPFFAFSGFGTPEMDITIKKFGALTFLHKPFETKEFVFVIQEALAAKPEKVWEMQPQSAETCLSNGQEWERLLKGSYPDFSGLIIEEYTLGLWFAEGDRNLEATFNLLLGDTWLKKANKYERYRPFGSKERGLLKKQEAYVKAIDYYTSVLKIKPGNNHCITRIREAYMALIKVAARYRLHFELGIEKQGRDRDLNWLPPFMRFRKIECSGRQRSLRE